MKILITGVSGTGKTTMSKALNERGIFAIDFSMIPNLCGWLNRATNTMAENVPITDAKWYQEHKRVCDLERLKGILDQYENVVITGAVGSSIDHFPLFDKVILLQCNPETFTHRMETRTAPYGKEKAERDDTVEWQKHFDPMVIAHGAIPVSTEGALETVADNIVATLRQLGFGTRNIP